MLALLAAPVTQKIHRHLLLTFTAAFVSGAERLCAAERGAGAVAVGVGGRSLRQRAHTCVCVSRCGCSVWAGHYLRIGGLFARPQTEWRL